LVADDSFVLRVYLLEFVAQLGLLDHAVEQKAGHLVLLKVDLPAVIHIQTLEDGPHLAQHRFVCIDDLFDHVVAVAQTDALESVVVLTLVQKPDVQNLEVDLTQAVRSQVNVEQWLHLLLGDFLFGRQISP